MGSRPARLVFCGLVLLAVVGAGCSQHSETKEARLKRANDELATGHYQNAEQQYRELLRVDANDSQATRQLGVLYYDQGQLRQAYPLLKQSAERQPDDLDIQLKLAQTYFAGRDYPHARELAQQILDKKPDQQDALLLMVDTAGTPQELQETHAFVAKLQDREQSRLAYHLTVGALKLREKDDAGAEAELKAALALDAKSSAVYSLLANLYWTRHDLKAADAALKTAADLSPPRSAVRLRYVNFKLLTAGTAEATKLVEEIARGAPDFLPARIYLMKIACAESRGDDCVARVDNILAQDPLSYDALFQKGVMSLGKDEATQTVRIFAQLSSMNDRDPRVHYLLARAYLASMKGATLVNARNALDAAENNLNLAKQLDPKLDQAVVLLAEIKIRKGSPAAAVDLLVPLVKERPELAQAQYLLASAYLAQQKRMEALAIYRQMTQAFPKDPQPPVLVGQILLAERKPAEARQAFEKSLQISPTYLPAAELLVDLDLADKQYQAALSRVAPLIDKEANNAQVWALRGKIYLAQNDFADAEPDLLKAVEINPKFEAVYLLLGQLYVASKQPEKAIEKLSAFTAANQSVLVLQQLAGIYSNQNQIEKARDTYEEVLKLAPNFVVAMNNLAVIYSERLGQLDKAYEFAKKARDLAPNEPHFADTLGWILFRRGDYQNALTALKDAATRLSGVAEIQYHLGMTYYMLGDDKEAQLALKKAVDSPDVFAGKDDARQRLSVLAVDTETTNPSARAALDSVLQSHPDDPMALLRLARLQERGGSPNQAITTYEKVLAKDALFVPALRRLAILYSRSSTDLAKAFATAEKARQSVPDDPYVADALGWVLFKKGEYRNAQRLLQNSAEKLPDQPELQFHLGMAHYMLGDQAAARAALQRAANDGGDFPGKADAQRRLALLDLVATTGDEAVIKTKLEDYVRQTPNDPIAQLRLGALQEQDGQLDHALATYQTILNADGAFAPALRSVAILYGKQPPDDLAKAAELATRARQAYPDDPQILKTLGILNYKRNFFPQAAEQLKQAAAQRQDDADLLYYLGESYRQLKQPSECKEALQRALSLKLPPALVEPAKQALAACAST